MLRHRRDRGGDRRAAPPSVELHAADLDPAAVACARRNVTTGQVHEGDLYDALPVDLAGRVDLLAVNAPYVPTDEIALMPPEAREHEHHDRPRRAGRTASTCTGAWPRAPGAGSAPAGRC